MFTCSGEDSEAVEDLEDVEERTTIFIDRLHA